MALRDWLAPVLQQPASAKVAISAIAKKGQSSQIARIAGIALANSPQLQAAGAVAASVEVLRQKPSTNALQSSKQRRLPANGQKATPRSARCRARRFIHWDAGNRLSMTADASLTRGGVRRRHWAGGRWMYLA